jgi:hypothetical protein
MAPDPAARPTARQLLLELTGDGGDPAAVTEHLRGTWVVPGPERATQVLGPPPASPRRLAPLAGVLLATLILAALAVTAAALLPGRGAAPRAAPTTTRRHAPASTKAPATTRPAPTTTAPAPGGGKRGEPVVDGNLRFVVASFACNRRTIGDLIPARASGRFCQARVQITNSDKQGHLVAGQDQVLIDTGGRRYRTHGGAMLRVADPLLLENIPPGATINGTLVWDLPKQRKAAAIELHESGFTEGATVSL